jgi:hypothetical protein
MSSSFRNIVGMLPFLARTLPKVNSLIFSDFVRVPNLTIFFVILWSSKC